MVYVRNGWLCHAEDIKPLRKHEDVECQVCGSSSRVTDVIVCVRCGAKVCYECLSQDEHGFKCPVCGGRLSYC